MKNLLFMGLLCLVFSVNLFSQTTEPSPLSFNWGTYTAPFNDSSHRITRPVLGWQWGANDSSFDNYIGANMTHGSDNNANSYKHNKIGMRTILNYNTHTYGGYRYDAEIITRLRDDFRPYKYDSSGAIFGWKWRNTSISQLDTATPQKPHGKVRINGSGLVLKNMSPNRGFGRPDTLTNDGQEWYLAINVRRTDSSNTDTTINTALSVKIKYWARNLNDSTKFPREDKPIIFEKLPLQAQWHSRGYWNDNYEIKQDSLVVITRKMLPLHGISGRAPDVTYFAYFRLTDWDRPSINKLNPMLSNATDLFTTGKDGADRSEGNYHIDSISVEVTGFGFPVSIDYIRLEEPNHKSLMLGQFDTTIHKAIQDFITDLRTTAPHVHLQGISPAIEYRWWSISSYRYLHKLYNGYAFSNIGNEENIYNHLQHSYPYKYSWNFPVLTNNYSQRAAAPWVRTVTNIDSCFIPLGSMGYHYGYWVHPLHGGAGDTTKSFYETSIKRQAGHEYLNRAKIISLDTMNMANFLDILSDRPIGFQSVIEYNLGLLSLTYGNKLGVQYTDIPWWSQKQIHVIWRGGTAPNCNHPNTNIFFEQKSRPYSGEEMRYLMWTDIIQGTKGFMIDNGGFRPVHYVYDKGKRVLETGYFTLRKVPNSVVYDPDSPMDTDFYIDGDSTGFAPFLNKTRLAQNLGIDSNRIYIGTKSARLNVKHAFDFMNTHADEIMRLRLVSWMTKGYKTFYSGDTAAMGSLLGYKMNVNQTGVRLRPLGRTLSNMPWYEPRDSAFYELSVLRDKNDTAKEFDSVFYVGVVNRRTDPLRMVRTPIHDTTKPKLLKFLSFAEYIDSCKVSPDSLLWQQEYWTQHGAREITIPFKVRGRDAGDYPLLRIQEMGGTLDTVIGCDRPLATKYLPGEGKIFRVRVQYPDRFTGDLAHSNQTKLVAHSIMRHDSVQNKWVEGDSVVYHAVYHKKIVGASARTGVYYRVSKPIAMASNTNALQWHNEILLSDSVEHHNRINLNDNCAYPALIVRFDSTMNTYNSFIVYGCTSSYSGDGTPFTGQHIVESIVALRRDTIFNKSHGVSLDTVHSNVLSDYGTPMINASDSVNFYVYSCAQRGIIAGWKKPRVIDRFLVNTVNFRFTHPLNCYDPVFDARHPSLNPYSRYLRGQKENDCIVVWQEKNTCVPRENIFTTRLRVQNDTIVYGLSPNFDIPTPYSVLFKHDSTIFCSSTMTQSFDTVLSHHFPVVYRELWHADDSSAYCHFQTYYPGHTTTDFHLDRVVWEVHQGGSAVNFLSDRGHWFYDTTIAGTMQPNRFGVGWLGHLWMGAYSYPMPISPPASLDQPSISAGTAAYFKDYPPVNWYGCVNSYTQRAMNLTFRHQAGGVTSIFSLPQTHAYPPIREFVQMIDHNNVTQSHVAARGSVLLNDWWRNHRIYNKTVDNGIVLDPYQIRSSGQHYYRFGQGNELRSLSVASFGNENGSFGIGTPSINDEEYMLYPYSTLPQRMEHPYYQTIDTLATAWFRVGDDEQLRYSFSGSNPQQATAYLERKSDGAQWILPSMPLREYTLSRLDLTLFNGNEEEYRIVTYGNENTSFIRNTALVYDNEEMSKISGHTLTLNLDELPMQQQSIRLYPNPANDELSVVWSGGKATVELLDSQGLTVFSAPLTTSVTLSTKELSSGVYMVRLKQGLHTQSMSVIVLH